MNQQRSYGIGLLGCGGFGEFCLHAYSQMPNVRPAAVADIHTDAAQRLGKAFNVPAGSDVAFLASRPDVDIIHIATPPSTHFDLAQAALAAGKHVLCEKPLAVSADQGRRIIAAAAAAQRICPVNFVLRYNRVTDAVSAILASGALGLPLSARLTNAASDSRLAPDHWFWDRSVSGGIFIEHGVHFFDLYAHWFGPGRAMRAHAETRPLTDQQDRVICLVRHDSGMLANHYHGFDQVAPMDRTSHRILCQLGDIRVEGWIPLSLTVDAAVDEDRLAALAAAIPDAQGQTIERYEGDAGITAGRGQQYKLTRRVRLSYTPQADKQTAYADSVRALLADQLAFLADPTHRRVVTESNGLIALELAEAATSLTVGRAT